MSQFLEERLPLCARMGATFGDAYNVEITTTSGDQEYRRLVHPFPVRHFVINFTQDNATLWNELLALYNRAYGMYAGFRVKCLDDFTSNSNTQAPTPTDMLMTYISDGVYQLQKNYGSGSPSLSIGLPSRTIFKPVFNTVKASIGGVTTTAFTVDIKTGIVTFTGTKNKSITGITKAASAVVTVGSHTFINGDWVYFSDVGGMTEINGMFGQVTSNDGTTITVAINSAAFSTYTGGGTVKIIPRSTDTVKAGFEFDIPCRFNSRIDYSFVSASMRDTSSIDLVELITL